jgi:hypothetical protein
MAFPSGCAPEELLHAAATGLVDAAEATRNPFVLSFALMVSPAAMPIPPVRVTPCAGAW